VFDEQGLAASRLQLPPGPWHTLLDGLCARFPAISRQAWEDRFARGRVRGPDGLALAADAPYRAGAQVRYFREVADEPAIPFAERVLHADDRLVVADKPHFLPVMPSGRHVHETLLGRLVRRLDNPGLAPLHRIDRETAGLVLFSADPATRDAYQALFRERRIAKRYEAIAPALPRLVFPHVRGSRLAAGEPFFRMREAEGAPNSHTRIEAVACDGAWWRYALYPLTGRKHQLRVHMAALGAPIRNDRLYPELLPHAPPGDAPALQLLAQGLAFDDPIDGRPRRFETTFRLEA
jgi:tRNA pseudouridine32 synthase/23S rRNA pseudouridine746 synthase